MASVRFQVDKHVSHALVRAVRRRGIDIITATEAGVRGMSDSKVLATSTRLGRTIVTHDDDYLRLAAAGMHHAGIAFCRPSARTMAELIETLELIHAALEDGDMIDLIEYL